MININIVYILGIVMITFIIVVIYVRSVTTHNAEIEKIESIEKRDRLAQAELDIIRSKTKKCPYFTEDNPRSCYFDSKYRCSWNEVTKRCDQL
jgi:hypothetical protein